jgi:hypothetical protein
MTTFPNQRAASAARPRFSYRLLATIAAPLITTWVLWRRWHYRRGGAPLTQEQRDLVAPYFDSALLDRVRVARIEHIQNPAIVRALMPLGLVPPIDLRRLWGMAFADTVVLAEICRDDRSCSVLFHELVHIAQYQAFGTHRFLSAYTLDWLSNGRDYWSISFEEEAYRLQRRFNRGEVFTVNPKLR